MKAFTHIVLRHFYAVIIGILIVASTQAQTTTFVFQSEIPKEFPATEPYEMEFRLYDAAEAGTQVGDTISFPTVDVKNRLYSVNLDFGSAPFSGADRFLEVALRRIGESTFVVLPRRQILSVPYAIRSLNAQTAEGALNLVTESGAVTADSFVQSDDPRLTDSRDPNPGSANYVQNRTTQQPLANFSISGTGKAGIFDAATRYDLRGTPILSSPGNTNLFAGFDAGNPSVTGPANSFFGTGAGSSTTTGNGNSFFGAFAGTFNTIGRLNAFFGVDAGRFNTEGIGNSFFGTGAGRSNENGQSNSFFGIEAGLSNTIGSRNAFFGNSAGRKNLGSRNSFFGSGTGLANTTGEGNSYFGVDAGNQNIAGNNNAFFGTGAGKSNVSGSSNVFLGPDAGAFNSHGSSNTAIGHFAHFGAHDLIFASAIGAGARVETSNTVVLGRSVDTVQVPGDLNVAGTFTGDFTVPASNITGTVATANGGTGLSSPGASGNLLRSTGTGWTSAGLIPSDVPSGSGSYIQNTTVQQAASSFNISGSGKADVFDAESHYKIGGNRILSATTRNLFVGFGAGSSNTTGMGNAFFGGDAGQNNTTGISNSFFGAVSGRSNTTGQTNAFFGVGSGRNNTVGDSNTFIGAGAGHSNIDGWGNVYVGQGAGIGYASGIGNVFVGKVFGTAFDVHTGDKNTSLGFNTKVADGLTHATAIGADSRVATSNTILLGRTTGDDHVRIYGLGAAGSQSLCRNSDSEISTCSSSLRYKTNIAPFRSGLNLVNRLRPITFDWKNGGMHDLGLGAEEVAEIEPLLVTYNKDGQVEGVKYDRIGVVLLNAVKEQQVQIERQEQQIAEQQTMIEELRELVCQTNGEAAVCK